MRKSKRQSSSVGHAIYGFSLLQLHLRQLYCFQIDSDDCRGGSDHSTPVAATKETTEETTAGKELAASASQLTGCCGLCHTGVTCIESEALGCISLGFLMFLLMTALSFSFAKLLHSPAAAALSLFVVVDVVFVLLNVNSWHFVLDAA